MWKKICVVHWVGLLWWLGPLCAEPNFIGFEHQGKDYLLQAKKIERKIWVDILETSRVLGAEPYQKRQVWVVELPTHKLAINPKRSFFSTLLKGESDWTNHDLPKEIPAEPATLCLPLELLPHLFQRSFHFHVQKQILSTEPPSPLLTEAKIQWVKVRSLVRDRKRWISVEDVAKTLGVVVYSSQKRQYNLVLPDFSILELRVGQKTVNKKRDPYVRLSDPVLLFKGSPYVTFRSLSSLFDINPTWDKKKNKIGLPVRYGRWREVKIEPKNELHYLGYVPEPWRIRVDEFFTYYQNIEPVISSDHTYPYESVRDFVNDGVINQKTGGVDRVSGEMVANLNGSFFSTPMDGRGSFEKVGSVVRVQNGTLEWGFPLFHVAGGREYETFYGLDDQFNLVDQVRVSHSNDYFDDNDKSLIYKIGGSRGNTDFSLFLSTAFFSQTVDFKQTYTSARMSLDYHPTRGHHLGFNVDHYRFENEIQGLSSIFHDADLFRDIFGEDFIIEPDPTEQAALTKSVLSDDHRTTYLNAEYEMSNSFELKGTLAQSHASEPAEPSHDKTDENWRVQTLFRKGKSRLEASYEKVDPHFRSMGNPLLYQNRSLYRLAPYFSFTKRWKLFGEMRREDSSVFEKEDIPPFSTIYVSAVNLLHFRKHSFKVSYSDYDSTLYGKRIRGNLDYTRYFGRHSFDVGGGAGNNWNTSDELFRQSYMGRVNLKFITPTSIWSLAQEVTRLHYPQYKRLNYESSTNFLLEIYKFKSLLQYQREPKSFLSDDRIYTGFLRLGYKLEKRKVLNVFYSLASLHGNLKNPVVWRVGLEFVHDF